MQIEKNKANVFDGAVSISYWKDSNFEFKIYQKITGLENGTYKLQVWSMGEKGGKTLNLFAKSKDNELKKNIVDTGWSKWNKFEITNIEVNNGELIIGVEGNCISGDWGKLDNFELIKTK